MIEVRRVGGGRPTLSTNLSISQCYLVGRVTRVLSCFRVRCVFYGHVSVQLFLPWSPE